MMTRNMLRFGAALALALSIPVASMAAEADNHVCYKLKDTNGVAGEAIAQFGGFLNCTVLLKSALMCVARDRDGGDDPRGGALGTTVCVKVKCDDTGGVLASSTLDTAYGTFGISADVDKPKYVCLPVGTDM